ncbi:hypothetical protein [Maricaulis sp.]|uniref:hypothetical protein n=1 Tax=Maricaulis sp. TaxID=1486257 RepID=UPI003A907D10
MVNGLLFVAEQVLPYSALVAGRGYPVDVAESASGDGGIFTAHLGSLSGVNFVFAAVSQTATSKLVDVYPDSKRTQRIAFGSLEATDGRTPSRRAVILNVEPGFYIQASVSYPVNLGRLQNDTPQKYLNLDLRKVALSHSSAQDGSLIEHTSVLIRADEADKLVALGEGDELCAPFFVQRDSSPNPSKAGTLYFYWGF